MTYTFPTLSPRPSVEPRTAWLIASGDLREAPNRSGWPTQQRMEADLARVFGDLGWTIRRANEVDPATGHGFISSQRMGLDVFATIPTDAPLIVAESVWQYSHHVLGGLRTHRGPILTVANFEGDAPGLVGLLGLNGGLTKMGKPYSTIWSVDFTDQWFLDGIRSWVETGHIPHDDSHVRPLPPLPASSPPDACDIKGVQAHAGQLLDPMAGSGSVTRSSESQPDHGVNGMRLSRPTSPSRATPPSSPALDGLRSRSNRARAFDPPCRGNRASWHPQASFAALSCSPGTPALRPGPPLRCGRRRCRDAEPRSPVAIGRESARRR